MATINKHIPTLTIWKIEVETWTRDEDNAGTNDRIDCVITFKDGRYFQQRLNNPNVNDFRREQRDRFRLNLNKPSAAAAVDNQDTDSIKSIQIKKLTGSNKWKCGAVGIRVNNVVVLSRFVKADLEYEGDQFTVNSRTDGKLDGLEIRIRTPNVNWVSLSLTYCNVVFSDNSVLYWPKNLSLEPSKYLLPDHEYAFLLPLSSSLNKGATDVAEIYLRLGRGIKPLLLGARWLLGAARLYANGNPVPLMGNRAINQFLGTSKGVSSLRDWSSRSILIPDRTTSADLPMSPAKVTYRISGPVLGHITTSSAKILYRVEREGAYRLKIYRYGENTLLQEINRDLRPDGSFEISNLQPNTAYRFTFFHILNGEEIPIPEGNGGLRTFPLKNGGVKRGGLAFLDTKSGRHKWTNCSIVTAMTPIERSRHHETVTQEPLIEVQGPHRPGGIARRGHAHRTRLTARCARHPDRHLAQAGP